MTNKLFENISSKIVKYGLWLPLILPLYVSTGLLFPFITGRNFAFRIVVEIIFAFWVGLAVLKKEYRPVLTPLLKSATIFIAVLFFADLFGPNPYRSFFSNYERMEGFMMLGHMYLYFLMLSGMFKTRKDWLVFFHVSLVTSIIVSFIALLQKFGLKVSLQGGFRVDSTIGNPAYLAAYLSFHVWLLLILLRDFWKKVGLRFFYLAVLLFELIIIYFTATRGAFVALFFGFAALFVVLVIRSGKKTSSARSVYHKWAVSALVLLLMAPVLLWSFRGNPIIRDNSVLGRLTSISLSDKTTQSRFLIWQMSLKGFLDRPIFGWGQENYYLVFQKYFDPGLYAQEPWFDRSHNIIVDWLVHAGLAGLFSFLSMIGIAVWGIAKSVKRNSISFVDGILLTVLFISYLLQNFFVFDSMNTYMLFFGFLAYSGYIINKGNSDIQNQEKASLTNVPTAKLVTAVVLVFVVSPMIYFWSVKPIQQSGAIIQGLMAKAGHSSMDVLIGSFQEALAYDSFGTTEAREQLGNVARSIPGDDKYSSEDKARFIKFAVQELRIEVSKSAKDIKHMIFLGSILDRSLAVDSAYALEAEKTLKEAITIAPTKQILYLELAQLYLTESRVDDAVSTLRKALELDLSYQEVAVNMVIVGDLAKKPEIVAEAKKYINVNTLNEDVLLRLGPAYQRSNDFVGARDVFVRLAEMKPTNAQYHATAAALLDQVGEYEKAVYEAEMAAKLDSANFGAESKIFIERARLKQKTR